MNNNANPYPSHPQPYGFDQPNNNYIDPSAAFGNGINPNALDLGQYQNSQVPAQRLPDGSFRNQSPAFPHTPYQGNSVIPAKRPRPGDDNVGASPRPGSDHQGGSRSQTPQQGPFPNHYPGQHGGQPFQPPTAYQHLHQNNLPQSTQSPMQQNQQFRPQGGPGQGQMAGSPRQFHNNNNNMNAGNFMQNNAGYPGAMGNQGYQRPVPPGQGFSQTPVTPGGMPPGSYGPQQGNPNQNLQEAQRRYQAQQAQLQQQLRNAGRPSSGAGPGAGQGAGQAIGQTTSTNASATPSTAGPPGASAPTPQQNGQPAARQAPPPIQASSMKMSEQNFSESLQRYLGSRGQTLEPNPTVAGRRVSYFQLFMLVTQHRILGQGPNQNNWSIVARALGIQDTQQPSAPEELKQLFQRNLLGFYSAWIQLMQKRKADQMRKQQQQGQPGAPANNQGIQGSPTQTQQPFPQTAQPQTQQPSTTGPPFQNQSQQPLAPETQTTPQPDNKSRAGSNGISTPQQPQQQGVPPTMMAEPNEYQQQGVKAPHLMSPSGGQPLPSPQQVGQQLQEIKRPQSSGLAQENVAETAIQPRKDLHLIDNLERAPLTWGGVELDPDLLHLGDEVSKIRPNVPKLEEMGVIDIHALTMSIQSGIHKEMRYALDQLGRVTVDLRSQMSLKDCGELVDTLIDCAEEQLDAVVGDSVEISPDEVNLTPFEDLSHAGRVEMGDLQENPEYFSHDYKINYAVERVLAVSGILRNLSFEGSNHQILTSAPMVKFMTNSIRYLGTHSNLFRNVRNTRDFMKDMIIILTNISYKIKIQTQDTAYVLLKFLLAFAPKMDSATSQTQRIRFPSYDPMVHHYLVHAVDSLAKLLATDDPNRTFYRAIFVSDNHAPPSDRLLTQAFALAICPIPQRLNGSANGLEMRIADKRKPFFAQGMLAADILVSFIPSHEANLARSWLDSEDGWAPSLLHMVMVLAQEAPAPQPRTNQRGPEERAFGLVTQPALRMIRQLVERVARGNDEDDGFSSVLAPLKTLLLGALIDPVFDPQVLKQVVAIAKVDAL